MRSSEGAAFPQIVSGHGGCEARAWVVGLSREGSVGIAEEGAVDGGDGDVRPDVEYRSKHILPNDRRGRAFLNDAATVQNHEALCGPGRLVQVMERHDHGQAVLPV